MNTQPPEPFAGAIPGKILDVHSCFLTVQGEGPYTGRRAVFLRLAGCNLQCPGCDTEYTEGRKDLAITEIIHTVAYEWFKNTYNREISSEKLVIITGGEPLRQNIGPLVSGLISTGWVVQIESNGMFEPDELLQGLLMAQPLETLMLVVSPKTAKINLRTKSLAHVFKYVLDAKCVDPDDGLPTYALEHVKGGGVARPRKDCPVYLTPYDNGPLTEVNIRAVVQSSLRYGYIAGLQLHKFLNLP